MTILCKGYSMSKKIFFIILFHFSFIAIIFASGGQDETYKNLKVVGLQTVMGTVQKPNIFFEGTVFNDIKPTKILGDKLEYYLGNNGTCSLDNQRLLELTRKKPIPLIYIYEVIKSNKGFSFRFLSDARGIHDDVIRLKGKTVFTKAQERKNYAHKIKNDACLEPMKKIIKIHKIISKAEFEKIPLKKVNETDDFIETLCLINRCYIWITFRKILK